MTHHLGLESIDHIQFSVLSEETWRDLAVCTVTRPGSYQSCEKDKTNTLFDERMGATEIGGVCQTCNGSEKDCQGHFGIIELAEPVYNKLFEKYILKLLRCLCPKCNRLRMPMMQLALKPLSKLPDKRIHDIHKQCQSLTECCWRDCRSVLPKIDHDGTAFTKTYPGKTPLIMSSTDIYNTLKSIDEKTCRFLKWGNLLKDYPALYNGTPHINHHRHRFHPKDLVQKVIPVIPPCARPYAIRDGQKYDDDLIDRYNTIIKESAKLNDPDLKSHERDRHIAKLHTNVWSIVSDEDTPANTKANRPRMTLKTRVEKKQGRVQLNIGGKRVNYSARGVIIGGGLIIEDDQLGIPEIVARNQTITETVTPWNITPLEEIIRKGNVIRIHRNGTTKRLDVMPNNGRFMKIQIGDKIDRYLQDGDIVAFNRQPTIRLESFMAFRAKIIPGYCFRLNICYTSGFNADFDGEIA